MRRKLSPRDGITAAKLSGAAKRYAAGKGLGDAVAELRAISANPVLLGHAAAAFLVQTERAPLDQHAPRALAYLRAAGADEQALAEEAVLVRERLSHLPHSI